jgi:uncharacterized protein YjbJ (UPF0337 family)
MKCGTSSRPCGATTNAFVPAIGDRTTVIEPGAAHNPSRVLPSNLVRRQGFSIPERSIVMNWDTVKGDWKQFRGKIKEQWGKLTDDDLDQIEGKRDQLLGCVQKRYGIARDEAEKQLKTFETASK